MNVVLSYGLGVDSTALLLRWLEEPDTRDFDLADLLVVTAMTGDEWQSTGKLVKEHVLPRLRKAGIRFAQVARAGASQSAGICVLDDSTDPQRLEIEGAYKLSEELTAAGTVPQVAGNRICSQKFKGWVIDTYLAQQPPMPPATPSATRPRRAPAQSAAPSTCPVVSSSASRRMRVPAPGGRANTTRPTASPSSR